MSSKGVIIIAKNNEAVDYVKMAAYAAHRVSHYLGLPTTLITDSENYAKEKFPEDTWDQIIKINAQSTVNLRHYQDGSLDNKELNFKNSNRASVYDLTPYDETILIDADYIISNNILSECFVQQKDLLLYKDAHDLGIERDTREFTYICDHGIDFYWATVVFFRKTEENKVFFDLIAHIESEWNHYRRLYQIKSSMFRNDYAFSIAIHIMNNHKKGNFVSPMPGTLYYTRGADFLEKIDNDTMWFTIESKDQGSYIATRLTGQSVHIMNKFSLDRSVNKELANV